MSIRRDEQIDLRAAELVRAAYDVVDGIRKSISPNSMRRDLRRFRYRRQYEFVREFLERAGTMLEFAGQLGLIDSDENGEIMRSVALDLPELFEWLEDEDKRL